MPSLSFFCFPLFRSGGKRPPGCAGVRKKSDNKSDNKMENIYKSEKLGYNDLSVKNGKGGIS